METTVWAIDCFFQSNYCHHPPLCLLPSVHCFAQIIFPPLFIFYFISVNHMCLLFLMLSLMLYFYVCFGFVQSCLQFFLLLSKGHNSLYQNHFPFSFNFKPRFDKRSAAFPGIVRRIPHFVASFVGFDRRRIPTMQHKSRSERVKPKTRWVKSNETLVTAQRNIKDTGLTERQKHASACY